MKARSLFFGSALLLAAAAILFCCFAARRAERMQAAESKLTEDFAALNGKIQADNRKLAALGRAVDESNPPKSAAGGTRTAGAGSGSSAASGAVDPRLVFASDPDLKARYLKLYRDSQGVNWALFFNQRQLAPEVRDRLEDLLAQQAANSLQVAQAASDEGLDPDSRQIKKLSGQLNRENAAAIAALLGPTDYQAYQQYHQELGVAPMVIDYAGNLTTEPLTAEQGSQLTQILAAASQKTQYGFAIYGTIDPEQAVSQAAAILSPGQLAALDAALQKYQASMQYRKLSETK